MYERCSPPKHEWIPHLPEHLPVQTKQARYYACQVFTARRNATHVQRGICHGRVPVRPSVTRRDCMKTAEWIELVCGTEASFSLIYSVLYGNLGSLSPK